MEDRPDCFGDYDERDQGCIDCNFIPECRDLTERKRAIKEEEDKREYTTLCPRCRSANITLDTSDFKSMGLGGATIYKCEDCGYTSNIFPEADVASLEREEETEVESGIDEYEYESKLEEGHSYWKYIIIGILAFILWPLLGILIILLVIIQSWRKSRQRAIDA